MNGISVFVMKMIFSVEQPPLLASPHTFVTAIPVRFPGMAFCQYRETAQKKEDKDPFHAASLTERRNSVNIEEPLGSVKSSV